MKKRYLSIALALILVFVMSMALVACNDDGKKDENKDDIKDSIVVPSFDITSVNGYEGVVIDKKNKTITVTTNDLTFDTTKIVLPEHVSLEVFDLTGKKLSATVNTTAMKNEFKITLTFSYKNVTKEDKWTLIVNKKIDIDYIEINDGWKDVYVINEKFDTNGKLNVVYVNGESEVVNITQAMVTGFDTTTLGNKELIINFDNTQVSYDIVVKSEYTLDLSNFVTDYELGTTKLAGTIVVTKADDTKVTIDVATAKYEGLDTAKVGLNTIKVIANDITVSVPVRMYDKSVPDAKPNEPTNITRESVAKYLAYGIASTFSMNDEAEFNRYYNDILTDATKSTISDEYKMVSSALYIINQFGVKQADVDRVYTELMPRFKELVDIIMPIIDSYDSTNMNSFTDQFMFLKNNVDLELATKASTFLNDLFAEFDKDVLATGVYMILPTIDYLSDNLHDDDGIAMNKDNAAAVEFYKNFKDLIVGSDTVQNIAEYKVYSYVVGKLVNVLQDIAALLKPDMLVELIDVSTDLCGIIENQMSTGLDLSAIIEKHSVKELYKYVEIIGSVFESIKVNFADDVPMLMDYVRDMLYRIDLGIDATEIDSIMGFVGEVSKIIFIIPDVFANLNTDDITECILAADAQMKFRPSNDTQPTKEDLDQYAILNTLLFKAMSTTGVHMYDKLNSIEQKDIITVVDAILCKAYEKDVQVTANFLAYMRKLDATDKKDIDGAKANALDDEMQEIFAPLFEGNSHDSSNDIYARVTPQGNDDVLILTPNTTEDALVNALNENFSLYIQHRYNGPIEQLAITADMFDMSKINTSVSGYQNIDLTINYNNPEHNIVNRTFNLRIRVFVKADDFMSKVDYFKLSREIVLYYTLNEDGTLSQPFSDTDSINYSIGAKDLLFKYDNYLQIRELTLENIDNKTVGEHYGYAKYTDKYIGDIYFNVKYIVTDPKYPLIKGIYQFDQDCYITLGWEKLLENNKFAQEEKDTLKNLFNRNSITMKYDLPYDYEQLAGSHIKTEFPFDINSIDKSKLKPGFNSLEVALTGPLNSANAITTTVEFYVFTLEEALSRVEFYSDDNVTSTEYLKLNSVFDSNLFFDISLSEKFANTFFSHQLSVPASSELLKLFNMKIVSTGNVDTTKAGKYDIKSQLVDANGKVYVDYTYTYIVYDNADDVLSKARTSNDVVLTVDEYNNNDFSSIIDQIIFFDASYVKINDNTFIKNDINKYLKFNGEIYDYDPSFAYVTINNQYDVKIGQIRVKLIKEMPLPDPNIPNVTPDDKPAI